MYKEVYYTVKITQNAIITSIFWIYKYSLQKNLHKEMGLVFEYQFKILSYIKLRLDIRLDIRFKMLKKWK